MTKFNCVTGVILTRAVAVLLLVCLAECATPRRAVSKKVNCLSYGHSCWGAHGKRNANPGEGIQSLNSAERLMVSKLLRRDLNSPDLPFMSYGAAKREALDGRENELYQHRRTNSEGNDERHDLAAKIAAYENSDEQLMDENAPLDMVYMDDARPAEKYNMLQILKEINSGYP